jgi:hypothetical protein
MHLNKKKLEIYLFNQFGNSNHLERVARCVRVCVLFLVVIGFPFKRACNS